jgi:DNA polymerase I-like protein with 3'-5' exonuclease and polymerase domains
MLELCIRKAYHWRTSQEYHHEREQEVFDIIDCGPNNRFSLGDIIAHNSSYGMGWAKLQMTLKLQGIQVSTEEAKAMVRSYWDIYAGVKDYEQFLLSEYKKNNGWVLNGIGRPIGVANDYLKDIVNRVIQSTGHDIHMIYIQICDQLLREAGIQVNGIVWDFHDQSILECAEEDKDKVYDIIGRQAYEVLNREYLQGEIALKGDPQHIRTLAEAKCE